MGSPAGPFPKGSLHALLQVVAATAGLPVALAHDRARSGQKEAEKEDEVEAAAPEEGAEPEVIKKGKAEEEGESSKE